MTPKDFHYYLHIFEVKHDYTPWFLDESCDTVEKNKANVKLAK